MPTSGREITDLLLAWRAGEDGALEQLAPAVYGELRRIAGAHMRGERGDHTLQPTALANEAYLRLLNARRIEWRDRTHFFAMASRVMRRVLVDAGRAHRADKRGGKDVRVSIDQALAVAPPDTTLDILALDEALTALAQTDARKEQVVELRFFGGLTIEETAAVLNVSTDTVMRDWAFARTWLKRALATAP